MLDRVKAHFERNKNFKILKALNFECLDSSHVPVIEKGVFVSLGKPCIECGSGCYVSRGTSFHGNGHIKIGNNVFINNNVWICSNDLSGGVDIGNDCLIGPGTVIIDNDHKYANNCTYAKSGYNVDKVVIGNNVWIGANCSILKGTVIGDNSIVGAGSVVKGKFDKNSVIVGNPAKVKLIKN